MTSYRMAGILGYLYMNAGQQWLTILSNVSFKSLEKFAFETHRKKCESAAEKSGTVEERGRSWTIRIASTIIREEATSQCKVPNRATEGLYPKEQSSTSRNHREYFLFLFLYVSVQWNLLNEPARGWFCFLPLERVWLTHWYSHYFQGNQMSESSGKIDVAINECTNVCQW